MTQSPGRSLPVDTGLLALLALTVVGVLLGRAGLNPYNAPELNLRVGLLPLYLLFSLTRLAVTLGLSVLLALPTGYLAARSRFARKLILPTLDVFQSVPVLGFFPVAVWGFIRLFGGSALGVEMAAVFLIFTSMFWNLAFGVYESLITIPEDLVLAAEQFNLRGTLRWRRLIVPAVVPSLLYNCLVSWANGWFFLIASEIIAIGPARYTLPGLGSYLAQAVSEGGTAQTVLALAVLLATTVAMHLLVWGPLETWAERFHVSEIGEHPRVPRIGRVLSRSRIVRWVTVRVAIPGAQQALVAASAVFDLMARHAWWTLSCAGLALPALGGYFGLRLFRLFAGRPLSAEIHGIPLDLALSFVRVALGVVFSAAASILLALWISRRQRLRAAAMPVIQVLASIPATAFFPLIVVLMGWGLPMNGAAILLALTTMFWYVLFNVLGAANAIPKELNEAATSFGLAGGSYLRRLFIPAIVPSLITGSLTAWGAGWNAMILCEYIEAGRRVYSVRGVGATLDRATYLTGDMQVMWASLAAMVLLIILVNRFFWDVLYDYAAKRYTMER